MRFVLDGPLVQQRVLRVAFEVLAVRLPSARFARGTVVDHRVVGRIRLTGRDVGRELRKDLPPQFG